MKAWRVYGINDMRLDEVPEPEVPEGWVLLKILTVQPSVTEVALFQGHETAGSRMFADRVEKEKPLQIFGHEFCAEVLTAPDGEHGLSVGSRVANLAKYPCGQCPSCRAGETQRCSSRFIFGIHVPGALAELAAAPPFILHALPEAVDNSEGCCLQPLTDAMACVESAGITPGAEVAILGQGVMGLYCLQAAKLGGAGRTFVSDVKPHQLELAAQLGADLVINASDRDPVQQIFEKTAGRGVDVVFEAAGGDRRAGLAGQQTLSQAIELVRPGGTIVPVALWQDPVSLISEKLRSKSVRLLFPAVPTRRTLESAVQKVARGDIRLKPLIQHVLQGIESVPEAFTITADKARYGAINPAQVHMR